MRIATIAVLASILTLGACDKADTTTQNPELLKGQEFVTQQNGTNITLKFDATEMRVYGKVVNNYSGPYEATGNQIKFGPFASTMMMGLPDAMTAERNYHNFMGTAETYSLKDNVLTIKNVAGDKMVFEKVDVVTE